MSPDAESPAEIQAIIEREGADWEAGETALTGLSVEEFHLNLGYIPGPNEPSLDEREQVALRNLASPVVMAPFAAVELPTRFDLRNVDGRNFVTPVRNQGNCGSCVAFGTVAAVEGALKWASQDPDLDVDYSEAHLYYCHAREQGSRCDNGWSVGPALDAFRNLGVVDEGCYPYLPGDQACTNLCTNGAARLTFIQNWRRYLTPASMKLWLTSSGPLIACLSVYEDFRSYRRGVYRQVTGDRVAGHCVCIVGYDDDQQCWIGKNSWGTGWGERGFFRIEYGNVGIDAEMWTVEGVQSWAPPNAAVFVSQSVPAAVLPGQSYDATVTMRNVGIQTWTAGRQYRLGSQNPQDNETWGLRRAAPLLAPIRPWQDATFRLRVTAPAVPSHFQWRMLREGLEWFGDYTADVVVPLAATPVRYGATVKLRHAVTGNALHSHLLVYGHPGTSGQQQVTCYAGNDDNDLWRMKGPDGQPDDFRFGQRAQHGDVIRLEHVLTTRNLHSHNGFPSPVTGQQEVTCFGESSIGDGNDNWRVEIDGGGQWNAERQVRLIHIGTDHALHSHAGFSHPVWTVGQQEVTGFPGRDINDLWSASDFRARDARFVSQSVPASLVAGQGQDVTVTMRNVGILPWTPSGQYRLGSQSPPDSQTWGLSRVELPGLVLPGQAVTFPFHVTAPAHPGAPAFEWQMLQEGVEWFGEPSRHVVIRVFRTAGPTTVPDVTGMLRLQAAESIRAADLVPRFIGAPSNLTEVSSQSPTSGESVERGTIVTLQMVPAV